MKRGSEYWSARRASCRAPYRVWVSGGGGSVPGAPTRVLSLVGPTRGVIPVTRLTRPDGDAGPNSGPFTPLIHDLFAGHEPSLNVEALSAG